MNLLSVLRPSAPLSAGISFSALPVFVAALLVATSLFPTLSYAADNPVPPGATEKEIEMGKKAAEQLAKDPKIKYLDEKQPANKALIEKLNAMAQKLGKASARPDIKYEIKVIDDPGLNAFTLPNGKIYFNKGLLDAAGSDDEIAGVMAHEIGHNANMHIMRLQSKAKPLNWVSIAAMLAMLSGKAGADIAQITPYILTGVVNSYSVNYEKEADSTAIPMMVKTGYNPSALVTFMNRLVDEERRRPKVELGIFQTHPPSPDRVDAAMEELKKANIPFTPRDVEGGKQAIVKEIDTKKSSVEWGTVKLLELTGADSAKRAKVTAEQINNLVRAGLKIHEISVVGDDKNAQLMARGSTIVSVSAAEAKAQDSTPMALAQRWRGNFQRLFWTEVLNGSL
jgi:Zn-dependent protease with chaperone function